MTNNKRFSFSFIFYFNSESFDLAERLSVHKRKPVHYSAEAKPSVLKCYKKPSTTEAKKSPQTLGLASSTKLVSAAVSESRYGSVVEDAFPGVNSKVLLQVD